MTHDGSEFDAEVRTVLEEQFPAAAKIEEQPVLETRRRPDFVVTLPMPGERLRDPVWVIETENDFGSYLTGIGQLSLYSGHFDPDVPVVQVLAYPESHTEEPELAMLQRETPHVIWLEIDAEQ